MLETLSTLIAGRSDWLRTWVSELSLSFAATDNRR